MDEKGQQWFDGLRTFATECRDRRPLIARDALSFAEEMQCRIIGGSLIAWLEKHGPCRLQERAVLASLQGWEKDPFFVFTSEQSGLVAASEILKEGSNTTVLLYPDEFANWLQGHPDQEYRWHVHTWSYFASLDADMAQRAGKYPLAAGETYWLHKEGTMCGSLFGHGGDHLWKWNGKEPTLLEEWFDKWVS
jgi:hypothetical protein